MSAVAKLLLDDINTVLFDLDGTLLDTAPDLVDALNRVCAERNHPAPDFELACRYVSTGAAGLIRLAFPDADAAMVENLRIRLVDLYAENVCVLTKPYPGMEKLLEQIESLGKTWGVVTNKPAALTEPLMKAIGLTNRSACIVSGDTLPQRKPDPAPIMHALDLIDCLPTVALYVGDAPQDIAAGQAAGVKTIAVSWGYIIPGHSPHEWGADYTIDRPEQLLALRTET
jgi:2-phosphoglycolate phosphatase